MPRPILTTTGKLPSRLLELEALAMTGKGPSTLRLFHGQGNDTAAIGETRPLGNIIGTPGGTDYEPWSTTNELLAAKSSDANDTAAGTGARAVKCIGVDQDFQEIEQEVDLNGTGAVGLPSLININQLCVSDAGSNLTAVGQVQAITIIGSNERYRATNVDQSRLKYCTPAGHTSFLREFVISAGSDVAGSADDDPAALVDIFVYTPLVPGDPNSWVRHQKISRAMTVDHQEDGGDDAMEGAIYSVVIPEGTLITGRLINRTTQQIRYYSYWTILQVPNELL